MQQIQFQSDNDYQGAILVESEVDRTNPLYIVRAHYNVRQTVLPRAEVLTYIPKMHTGRTMYVQSLRSYR